MTRETGSDDIAAREARHGDSKAAQAQDGLRFRLEDRILPTVMW